MPQNLIPSHPAAAAAAGAGTPVQVHQGAPANIPTHPGVVQQHVSANPPAPPESNDVMDFFASVGLDDSDSMSPPPAPPSSSPSADVDLVSTDDLLSGGEFPEPPPPPQAPASQPQPQAPEPQVQQQPQPQAPQSAPAQPQAAPSPDELQTAAIDFLRGNTYKLNDDMTRRALSEPEAVLPELAARVHVNVVHEMAQQIHRVVPMLVERAVQQRTAVLEAKNDFFRRYPKLNRPEWEGVIAESLTMASQLHQGKDRDTIMREGAALAAYRLRGQVTRRENPNRQLPYQPAAPGGGGPVVPTNPQQSNPWADLAADPDLMNW